MLQFTSPPLGDGPVPPPLLAENFANVSRSSRFIGTDGVQYLAVLYMDSCRQMWRLQTDPAPCWLLTDYAAAALLFPPEDECGAYTVFVDYWFDVSEFFGDADFSETTPDADGFIDLIFAKAAVHNPNPRYRKVAEIFSLRGGEFAKGRLFRPRLGSKWHRAVTVEFHSPAPTEEPLPYPSDSDSNAELLAKHAVCTKFIGKDNYLCKWIMCYDGSEHVFRQSEPGEEETGEWVRCTEIDSVAGASINLVWSCKRLVTVHTVLIEPK